MITYEFDAKTGWIKVRLERKYIGDIRKNKANGWFFYKPKGGKRGDEMGTIAEVKASLEEE